MNLALRDIIKRLERHTCVTAGAGAGKTTTLVDTYLGLLAGESGPLAKRLKPNEIVAITFTEKAAGEMRQRVVERVAGLAASGQSDDPGFWRQLLPLVEWAPITTIHSFCASLLREFGVHLGLDPDFAVLDAEAFSQLLEEVISDVLRSALARGDDSLTHLLSDNFSFGGSFGLPAALSLIISALSTSGISVEQAQERTAQAHAEQEARFDGLLNELDQITAEMAASPALSGFNPKAKYAQRVKDLAGAWPDLRKKLQDNPTDSAGHARLKALWKGNWGKLLGDMRRQGADLAVQLNGLAATGDGAKLSQCFLLLAGLVMQSLVSELARRSALSFDGLLLGARDLLRNHPQVLSIIRSRLKALLVDEFQDVNPVQGELVELLTSGQDGPVCLLVGDSKQSIYAFRGAEVGLMQRAREQMELSGGQVVALPENFRSRLELVEFFNRLFSQVFSTADPVQGVEATPFGLDDEQVASGTEKPALGPAVVSLEVEIPQGAPVKVVRELEAAALARYLNQVFASGQARPGDVAILLRRLTQVRQYEQALRDSGLDYYTVRGRGFFDTQEIADILWALKGVLDPRDDIALTGLLRSPLVGLSDESLLRLCHPDGRQRRRVSQAFHEDDGAGLSGGQAQRWRAARELLHGLSKNARRMTPAGLVEAIIGQSGVIPVLLATRDGEQKVANLRKLLESARAPSGVLRGSVEQFTAGLAGLVANPPQDPQAPLAGEEAQVVRIMTVHQAKGLQFPLVVLADLAGGGNIPSILPPPAANGVFASAPYDPLTGERRKYLLYKDLYARNRAVAAAEEARLFYVACTRAVSGLVLVRPGPLARKKSQWPDWAELAADDPAVVSLTADDLPAPVANTSEPPALAWPDLLPPKPGALKAQAAGVIASALQRQPPPRAMVSESVSGLEAWFQCPRLYAWTRRWGLDTGALGAVSGQGAKSRPDPVAMGSVVHNTLEICDLWAGPQALSPALDLVLGDPGFAGVDRSQAREIAQGFWDTGLARMIRDLPKNAVMREQGFTLHLGQPGALPQVQVIGEIDLVLVGPGGATLVDYKVSANIHPEDYRDQLGIYALALSRALGAVPKAMLCYLSSGRAELVEMKFTPADLAGYERKIIKAGAEIAALPMQVEPESLSPGPGCDDQCRLQVSGWCQGKRTGER